MEDEIFKPIKGYEDIYFVSENGNIKNEKFNRFLKPEKTKNGYFRVALSKKDIKKRYYVHTLVAKAFIGDKPIGKQINHKNGSKTDNRFLNLEYVTGSENMLHSVKNGFSPKRNGSKNGRAKLNEIQIKEIRKKYDIGKYSNRVLAKEYGISESHMSNILSKNFWKI